MVTTETLRETLYDRTVVFSQWQCVSSVIRAFQMYFELKDASCRLTCNKKGGSYNNDYDLNELSYEFGKAEKIEE